MNEMPMRKMDLQMINPEPPKKIKTPSIQELIKTAQSRDIDISTPPNKEFIIPLTLDNNKIQNPIFIPKKKHKTRKIYKVYKIYKKRHSKRRHKRHTKRKHSKKTNRNKTYKLTTFPFI